MSNEAQNKSWLAAEHALGVTEGKLREEAERLVERDATFRKSVDGWQNQLFPILDEIDDVTPSSAIWQKINQQIAPEQSADAEQSASGGIWKLITTLSTTVAVASLGGLLYISGGDFSSGTITDLKKRLEASQDNIANANSAFQEIKKRADTLEQQANTLEQQLAEAKTQTESVSGELANAKGELVDVTNKFNTVTAELEGANTQVANARAEVDALKQEFNSSRPLVASLTQSGDVPAFVAQYDPIKKALLIRTAVEDTDEKVPEIWLIPAQGNRKGEVLSLGVMNEDAPDEVKITDDFLDLIGEGGTLAITMEPPGGSPTGVATGPVIALGKLQAF